MIDQEEWMKRYTSTEDLDPELVPWLEETDFIGNVLKHPLVFQVPFMSNGQANDALKYKKEALATAMREKKWNTVIFLHERPYRLEALLSIVEYLNDEEYWEMVSDVWTDSENIWQNFEEWMDVLQSDRPGRRSMMDEDEQAFFDALPDEIEVYRGCNLELNEDGLSWSVSHERATWFGKRWLSRSDREGRVIHGKVKKEAVAAYLNGRNEEEIVVAYPDDVKVVSYEHLEDPMPVEIQ